MLPVSDFVDDLCNTLLVMHTERFRELTIREWARKREDNLERRIAEPAYPDFTDVADQLPLKESELEKACKESLFSFNIKDPEQNVGAPRGESGEYVSNPLGVEGEDKD